MVDEDREAQREFVREYIADLNPLGAVEVQLARTLAMDNWRLNRNQSCPKKTSLPGATP